MSDAQVIEIPQDVFDSAKLTKDQMRIELALTLYSQKRLSIGKSRELAGLTLWEFRQYLGQRRIQAHYDIADLKEDIHVLKEADRL
jgi:predicted HTH domain antitoxin